MPVLAGWFEGRVAWSITTDVSDAAVAQEKAANHAPRLADALPPAPTGGRPLPGTRNPVDKVYAFTNFKPRVVVNCPIVQIGESERLPGVALASSP